MEELSNLVSGFSPFAELRTSPENRAELPLLFVHGEELLVVGRIKRSLAKTSEEPGVTSLDLGESFALVRAGLICLFLAILERAKNVHLPLLHPPREWSLRRQRTSIPCKPYSTQQSPNDPRNRPPARVARRVPTSNAGGRSGSRGG